MPSPPAIGAAWSPPSAISAEWSAPAFGEQSPAFGDQCQVVCVKRPPLLFGATRRRGMIHEHIFVALSQKVLHRNWDIV